MKKEKRIGGEFLVDMDLMRKRRLDETEYWLSRKWLDRNYPGGYGATLDYDCDFVVDKRTYDKLRHYLRPDLFPLPLTKHYSKYEGK